MNKNHPETSFRNARLDRARPKRHFLRSLVTNKNKRHQSEVGVMNEGGSGSSNTVVRVILGLLLFHIIVIGGVFLRSKSSSGTTAAESSHEAIITSSPSNTSQAKKQAGTVVNPQSSTLSTPVVSNPVVSPTSPAESTHITQAGGSFEDDMIADDPEMAALVHNGQTITPVKRDNMQDVMAGGETKPLVSPTTQVVKPVIQPTQSNNTARQETNQASTASAGRHLICSGENWTRIAKQYGLTEAQLKAANPKAAARPMLYAGEYLALPSNSKNVPAHNVKQADTKTLPSKTHTVSKGETLGAIARKHKTTVDKLKKINKFTDKQVNQIKIGQVIIIAE